ncbi:hypothetical protein LZQ00_06365 [Sphingobacterium sp. SRCM116780]|uniref:hypothetical protein n=1 Tax=Sphingobacterium sp. SRCM116780 TaxID=2907623 RepID=UPI001F2B9FB8|nr:hypothetical protein [Sphingobacterium sp. SRCM116780]UIR57438.1 hypothetical protein LZQ00_06365 [Sphingobacterium sp. SRCM116780]
MEKKKEYVGAILEVVYLEMEYGLATSSDNILTPGGVYNNPDIEEWQDNGPIGENNLEL